MLRRGKRFRRSLALRNTSRRGLRHARTMRRATSPALPGFNPRESGGFARLKRGFPPLIAISTSPQARWIASRSRDSSSSAHRATPALSTRFRARRPLTKIRPPLQTAVLRDVNRMISGCRYAYMLLLSAANIDAEETINLRGPIVLLLPLTLASCISFGRSSPSPPDSTITHSAGSHSWPSSRAKSCATFSMVSRSVGVSARLARNRTRLWPRHSHTGCGTRQGCNCN